jgi:hypothetical protein
MDIQIQPGYIRAVVLGLVLLSVVLTSTFGFRAGRDLAKSYLVVKQVAASMKALDYFYQDQDRYPSSAEFDDKSALGVYATLVPFPQVTSKDCPGTLAYDTFDERNFTLSYCITRELAGQAKGVHKITERDIPAWR